MRLPNQSKFFLTRNYIFSQIEKGPESSTGTLKPAWKALLSEADELAIVHENRDQQLRDYVSTEAHRWRKEHYPRHLRAFRATKEAHDRFEKGQKPWAKLIKNQRRWRKQYFLDSGAFESAKKKLSGAKSGKTRQYSAENTVMVSLHLNLTLLSCRPQHDLRRAGQAAGQARQARAGRGREPKGWCRECFSRQCQCSLFALPELRGRH